VLVGGLVLLAVIAERWFGFELERRQWIGVLLTAGGLALLAITGDARSGQDSADYSVAAMLIFEAALTALGVALILSCRSERRRSTRGSCSAWPPACCSRSPTSRSRL
jgi:drug/metabolite transporter (DMT)-like permease